MLNTFCCRGGMVTAPHHLAALAGRDVLREGGNAVEAMVAAAAVSAVAYPHMTGIGGDGFWLISDGSDPPIGIDACGATGINVDAALYAKHGHKAVPWRGPLAANTVAGTVSGWDLALRHSASWGTALPLERLLEPAIHYAEHGVAVSGSQNALTTAKLAELIGQAGFAAQFLADGAIPATGSIQRFPALARTLRRLARHGLRDFYEGEIARELAAELFAAGAPLTLDDLARHRALLVAPLSTDLRCGRVYNLPPPTQGLASLLILGLFDRLSVTVPEGFDHVHSLIEATKQAFLVRDRVVQDPCCITAPVERFLEPAALDGLAARIDRQRALPWPAPVSDGDTVWVGAIDGDGRAVSFIQSLFFEFGSGIVLPGTGVTWQNRGASLQLDPAKANFLAPGRKPFHTLNPAMARLADDRLMVYGTMGGEGQPQTQAAIFTRYAMFGQELQQAVTQPRWLLGRTWGETSTSLKLENRFDGALVEALRRAEHDVELIDAYSSTMGHAGALVRRPCGTIEGAADPRSDGLVAGF